MNKILSWLKSWFTSPQVVDLSWAAEDDTAGDACRFDYE